MDETVETVETEEEEAGWETIRPYAKDPKREELLAFVIRFCDENGYPPSTREMAEGLKYKSLESVHRLLLKLRDEKRISWEPRKARTLKVL